jgi:hypothetical protein
MKPTKTINWQRKADSLRDAQNAAVGESRPGIQVNPMDGFREETLAFQFALVALFILLILIRIYYFNRFWVPDSDFFSLKETARALIQFEPPPGYQRLPLFSVAMGLLSRLLPGENAILFAGEVINFASFIATTILLYRITRRLSGPYVGFATVCLFGLHPETIMLTAQPEAQMMSITLVLLGIDLSQRERRTAYVAAGLASIVRYEGAFLIAALAARDLLFSRRRLEVVVLAGLASTGLLGWLMLNFFVTGHINPYYSYLSEPAAGLLYLKVVFQTIVSFSDSLRMIPQVPLAIVLLSLIMLGFWSWFLRSPANVLPIALFLAACTVLNMSFFSATSSHVFMTLWIFLMAIPAGVANGLELVSRWFVKGTGAFNPSKPVPSLLCLSPLAIAAAGVCWIFYRSDVATVKILWAGSFSVLTGYIFVLSRKSRLPGLIAASVAVCLVWLLLGGNTRSVVHSMGEAEFAKVSMRLVGEWYKVHARPGERLLVSEPWVVQEYAPAKETGNILPLGQFRSQSPEEFASDLANVNVQYVVWDSHHGRLSPDSYYYRKYRMDLIAPLAYGRNWGPFEFLDTVGAAHEMAHIYRFRR